MRTNFNDGLFHLKASGNDSRCSTDLNSFGKRMNYFTDSLNFCLESDSLIVFQLNITLLRSMVKFDSSKVGFLFQTKKKTNPSVNYMSKLK